MPTYRLDILVTGTDRASGKLTGIRRALQRIFQIASGILIAGTFRLISQQIFDLGRTAIESFSNLERMEVSLQSLVAREMARGETVEETTSFIRNLTDSEILALDKLIVKYSALGEEMLDLKEDQAGLDESDIDWLANSVAIRETTIEMSDLATEIERMQGLQGKLVTVTTSSLLKTLSLADALGIAAGPAEELTDWVVRLSLNSPFSETDVLQALRVAAGYGFITQHASELLTEEDRLRQAREDDVVTAQRLTVGLLDLMAAIGLPSENLGRIVLALGQVRAHGRLLAQEIRQMVNAGVGLDVMAMAMGMTVEEFMNLQKEGKIMADDFLPALVNLLEEDLAGAADRIMNTFGGAILSLQKFREVGLRTFFGPLFEAITPGLRAFADKMISQENLDKIEAWGILFRDWVFKIYRQLQRVVDRIKHIKDLFDKYSPLELTIKITGDIIGTDLLEPLENIKTSINEINEDLGVIEDPEGAGKGALIAGLTVLLGPTVINFVRTWGPKLVGLVLGIGTKFTWLGVVATIAGFLIGGNWTEIKDKIVTAWEQDIRPALEKFGKWLGEEIPKAQEKLRAFWDDELLPALQTGWEWIEDELLPTLREWAKIILEKVRFAIRKLTEWINEDLIPALVILWGEIREEVIPAFKKWAEEGIKKAQSGLLGIRDAINDDVIPKLQALRNYIVDELLPKLINISEWFANEAKWGFSNFDTAYKKFVQPTFFAISMTMAPLLEEDGPLKRFENFFTNMADDVFGAFGGAWDEYVKPILEFIGGWTLEHVVPVLREISDFLHLIVVAVLNLGGDAFSGIMTFLGFSGGTQGVKAAKVLGLIADILTVIWEIFVVKGLGGAMEAVADFAIPKLESAFRILGYVLDGIAATLKAINDLLRGLMGIEPGGIMRTNSPTPLLATLFDAITESITTADETLKNSLFTKQGMGISRIPPGALTLGDANGMMSQPAPVVLEGDTNTFLVTDRDTYRYIKHQIEETRKKRFSEYMGKL